MQKISIDNRDWWVGWEIDNASGEIPGLIRADKLTEAELRDRGVTEFRKVNSNLLQKVERRRASRYRLDPGIDAKLGDERVLVRDISIGGLGILHRFPLSFGMTVTVSFDFQDEAYSLQLEVLRCSLDRTASSSSDSLKHYSALRLTDPNEEEQLVLRGITRKLSAAARDGSLLMSVQVLR